MAFRKWKSQAVLLSNICLLMVTLIHLCIIITAQSVQLGAAFVLFGFQDMKRIVSNVLRKVSCDDTAICILNSDKKILSSRRYVNREVQKRLRGICPAAAADQHRSYIDLFVDECLDESGMRLCNLDGVAVTTRPGLIISLRVGTEKAIALARKGCIPLIPVHHMQAHATIATLMKQVSYPYVSVLISGGHSIIAITNGPDDFEVLLTSTSGSPGECIDKISRALNFKEPELLGLHPGAALEVMASRSSVNGFKRYSIDINRFLKMDLHFNFSWIKATYLVMISRQRILNVPDFCASVQHSIAKYLVEKLDCCLQYLNDSNKIPPRNRLVFVSGGVASNKYILAKISGACESRGYSLCAPPQFYCCDNAEMIAWNGIQLLTKGAASVILPDKIPASIFVSSRSRIGVDISQDLRKYLAMTYETSAEAAERRNREHWRNTSFKS
ncbi:glycoprotease [Loa loa]|uniref:N(6)-L-threonylcarbamoyladenine synthase n=1 Tax=Loa loa TaxID=7209 RepID=A0A1S0TRQ0_LOALO|nr:glycoprotease [Loa loa]EFO18200.2 glycoprotease [Loa loa]